MPETTTDPTPRKKAGAPLKNAPAECPTTIFGHHTVRGGGESADFEPIREAAQHFEVLERLWTAGGAIGRKVRDGRFAEICEAEVAPPVGAL